MNESTIKLDGKLIELLEKVKETRKKYLALLRDSEKPETKGEITQAEKQITYHYFNEANCELADYLIENEEKDK